MITEFIAYRWVWTSYIVKFCKTAG